VTGNYVHDQGHPYGGLYHDEGSGHFVTTYNVVQRVHEWLHIWNPNIHDIRVIDSFTDSTDYLNQGTNCTVTETTEVLNGKWPLEAIYIMKHAGRQSM
jgi:hypothetical protein